MKPDDILHAIGDVDDTYIKKAHRTSLIKALLVFLVILILGISIAFSQLSDYHLLLRYNPDGTVLTEYIEPEAIIYSDWTSMEYTAYHNGVPASTAQFQRRFNPNYAITLTRSGEETLIVGSNGDDLWPHDYLEEQHFANLYISAVYSNDLIDRIAGIYINSETAYGIMNQQLNRIRLEYLERSDLVLRQTLVTSGTTPEEEVLRSRGYDYQYNRISGWKEWDADGTLLAYAQYSYDGNIQVVSSYLADGSLTGTRISKYTFGNLRWREYYDADGSLTGREIYRYRFWEPFFCIEGIILLLIILSLAFTAAFAVWDDRLQLGTIIISRSRNESPRDYTKLLYSIRSLNVAIDNLADRLGPAQSSINPGELSRLSEQMEQLRGQLAELLPPRIDNE